MRKQAVTLKLNKQKLALQTFTIKRIMMLQIAKGKQVKFVQAAFSKVYPYLKIELLKQRAGKEELMRAEEITSNSNTVWVDINKQQTVANVEREFLDKTSLRIKMYRKFCNVWVETLLTEDWTLEQQNNEGELLSKLNKNPLVNTVGYVDARH